MDRMRILSWLLLGTATVAGCSERNMPTAPSGDAVALSPAGSIGDRPYTWTVKCSGDFASQASWSWTTSGLPITGTEMSVVCYSAVSGGRTRPAAADGFSACVNYVCQSWTFDPTGAFKAALKGTYSYPVFDPSKCDPFGHHLHQQCYLTATATLTVDS